MATKIKQGDTVYYCADKHWDVYKDMSLVADVIRDDLWTLSKPDGYRTTNIPASHLSKTPVPRPTVFFSGKQLREATWMTEQLKPVDELDSSIGGLELKPGDYLEDEEEEEPC